MDVIEAQQNRLSFQVEEAFNLLFNEFVPKGLGFIFTMYNGIRRRGNKYLKLPCKRDYIGDLIKRAEPELNNTDRQRERHAKTIQMAQEEVLTCIGMCLLERVRCMYIRLQEEDRACHVLAIIAINCLYQSFDRAVEKKRGISNLDLLCEEISREERVKEQRREQKKLKKRLKRMERDHRNHDGEDRVRTGADDDNDAQEDEEEDEAEDGDKDEYEYDDGDENDMEDELGTSFVARCQAKADRAMHYSRSNGTTPEKTRNNRKEKQKQVKSGTSIKSVSPSVGHHSDSEGGQARSRRTPKHRQSDQSHPSSIDCGYVSDQPVSSSSTSKMGKGGDGAKQNGYPVEEKRPVKLQTDTASSSSSSTINSQIPSLFSTPEGSEVVCPGDLCNHVASDSPVVRMADQPSLTTSNYSNGNLINYNIAKNKSSNVSPDQTNGSTEPASVPATGCSFIPEDQINEFRSRYGNLKEVREELRQNLRQKFAQFCLKNKCKGITPLAQESNVG